MRQPSNRSIRIFLWLFMLVGVIAIVCGAWNLFRGLRCEHWPTTEGVIKTAEMEYHSGSDDGGTYSASIYYNYQVAGTNYTSTQVAFGETQSSEAHAQAILNRFTSGQKVSVHYAPDNPELAVLETGIHSATWIWFLVGTVFLLAGWMFLKQVSANPAAQTEVELQQPPKLMGAIFIVMGSFVFFMEPASGVPVWVLYAAGGFFVLMGLFMLACHLQNKLYSEMLLWAGVLTLLVIFHWVSFGPGERIGTITSPFSQQSGANVRPYFAAFTVLIDLAMLAFWVRWLIKGRMRRR